MDERRGAGNRVAAAALTTFPCIFFFLLFTGLLVEFVGFAWVMRRDPAVTVATRMMIVHVVSVIPDVVGAGPQYQNEQTQ